MLSLKKTTLQHENDVCAKLQIASTNKNEEEKF